ncbi:MAG: SelB C-terminal domain-containing protein [Verrucomicrobiales bacterium]
MDPPSPKEIATGADGAQAFQFLIDSGEVISLSEKAALLQPAYGDAVRIVRDYISQHGPATVSDLREPLGTTRRILVPLLEKLDAEGITVRQGDLRALK